MRDVRYVWGQNTRCVRGIGDNKEDREFREDKEIKEDNGKKKKNSESVREFLVRVVQMWR